MNTVARPTRTRGHDTRAWHWHAQRWPWFGGGQGVHLAGSNAGGMGSIRGRLTWDTWVGCDQENRDRTEIIRLLSHLSDEAVSRGRSGAGHEDHRTHSTSAPSNRLRNCYPWVGRKGL